MTLRSTGGLHYRGDLGACVSTCVACGVGSKYDGDIDAGGETYNLPHLLNIRIDRDLANFCQIRLRHPIPEQQQRLLWIATL